MREEKYYMWDAASDYDLMEVEIITRHDEWAWIKFKYNLNSAPFTCRFSSLKTTLEN